MLDYLTISLVSVQNWHLTVGKLLGVLLVILLAIVAKQLFNKYWKEKIYEAYNVNEDGRKRIDKYLRQLLALLSSYVVLLVLGLDVPFFQSGEVTLRWGLFFIALIILVASNIINWLLGNIVKYSYTKRQTTLKKTSYGQKDGQFQIGRATNIIRYAVLVLAAILIIRNFDMDISLYQQNINGQDVDFRITKILVVALVILFAQLVYWVLTNVVLYGVYRQRDIDEGSQYAVNQILRYIIYLIAFFMSLNSLGINMTLILGGAAALLVGVGLGLQQTFNDFFSGLVLLFERSVSVGDFLRIGTIQGTIKKIGPRSSIIETLDNQNVIIPNSKLVNENVNNWNHFDNTVRFEIEVGVAYGSDTELVKSLLLEAVKENKDVLSYPQPYVLFDRFGDSSLDFRILYYSSNLVHYEHVKSDLRFRIDALFREHNIAIPFPQRDIWIRKEGQ